MNSAGIRGAVALGVVWALGFSSIASAQEPGRTDGPEGSEYGKGGYRDPGGAGDFSLELNFGAALNSTGLTTPPLYAGLTAAYWADDWFLLEGSAGYNFNADRLNILVGPRFRTAFFPVSLYAGLQAGAIISTSNRFEPALLRFAISPNAGADLLLNDNLLLGLGYHFDFVFGGFNSHRILMNVGWRF